MIIQPLNCDKRVARLLIIQKNITIIMAIYMSTLFNNICYFNLLKIYLILKAGYIVTWTPYAIVSLYSAFINPGI
jgi:hypothetical protein